MRKVKKVKVGALETITPPRHYDLLARKICDSELLTVARVFMSAHGGAEIDEHPAEHVFYVLRGSAKMFDGKESFEVEAGDSIIVESGETHSFTGNGKEDCEYLVVTLNRSAL